MSNDKERLLEIRQQLIDLNNELMDMAKDEKHVYTKEAMEDAATDILQGPVDKLHDALRHKYDYGLKI